MDDYVNVNGVKIAYTLAGRGQPLLFLHGWMCNRQFWKKQIEFFSKRYRVLTMDFRGQGESDVPAGGYTPGRLADDVFAVMKNLGIDRTVVIGHSMGGMVAQVLCKNFPQNVSGLVLVTTIAADLQNRLISKRIEKDSVDLGFRKAFLKYFNGWFASQTDPVIGDWVREEMLKTPEKVGLELVRAYSRFDLRAHLPDFRMPCLVMGARDDTSAVPVEPQTLAKLIPGSRLIMIETCGHFPMLEKPEEFGNLLDEFLSDNSL
jgi:pimeloyl-ACP methyl ester carboxylesterase